MRLTLSEWNEQYFARPRTKRTLYRYISSGKIYPAPKKVGRDYEVEDIAILIDDECISNQNSLMDRIHEQKAQARKQRPAT